MAMAASLMSALIDCYELGEIPALSTNPGFGIYYIRGAGPKTAVQRATAIAQTFQCAMRWAESRSLGTGSAEGRDASDSNLDLDAIREVGLYDAFSEMLRDTVIVFVNWVLYGASTYSGVSNGEALYSGTVIGKSIRNIVYNFVPADLAELVTSKF